MTNRYLIVSDLHLCDVEDNPDGWKAYKSSRFVFDAEFRALLDRFVANSKGRCQRTLILNGDIFDFDLLTAVPDQPTFRVRRSERRRGLDATEKKSIWKLKCILEQHPIFIDTLARFVSEGGKLVYILGNHDREFAFLGVREAFCAALRARMEVLGAQPDCDLLRFEPWFYRVPGEIYVEHGQQYDHYSAFRHVLRPTVRLREEEVIALPMGNLSNRYLMSRMGYFNPHASDYILNMFSYFWHWLTKYAFTRRSLAFVWFTNSLVVMGKLLKIRKLLLGSSRRLNEVLPPYCERYELDLKTVKALYKLQHLPITSRFFRVIREFWIDRVVIALIMTGGTIALALVPIPLWIKLMVPLSSFPLAYLIYEHLVQGESIFTAETRFPQVARRVAQLVNVRLVAFGHTHQPRMIPLDKGTTFVDTGCWAPVTEQSKPQELKMGLRNYVIAEFTAEQAQITFGSWQKSASVRGDRTSKSEFKSA